MEKKKTAVEFIEGYIELKARYYSYNYLKLLIEQAKAIEKEQLIDFFMIGQDIGTSIEDAEETYNETYGNAND